VHDNPEFLSRLDHPGYAKIFITPREDPFRKDYLDWLEEHHPALFHYGASHEELLGRDLFLAAKLSEIYPIDRHCAIVIIGAGTVGLSQLFIELFGVEKITVIDLPSCLAFAAGTISRPEISWITPEEISSPFKADLVISDTIFSHLSAQWQRDLFNKIFSHVQGGALFYESVPRHWGVKAWRREQFLYRLERDFDLQYNLCPTEANPVQSQIEAWPNAPKMELHSFILFIKKR
jgi:hypothetical protein